MVVNVVVKSPDGNQVGKSVHVVLPDQSKLVIRVPVEPADAEV